MLRVLVGLFLVAHGLVHVSLATVPGPEPGGLNTPFWPAWWRADTNSAWLVTVAGIDNAALRWTGGLLVMVSTLGFVLAGLGALGLPGLDELWRPLAIASAAAAIPLFVFYWHPWLVVGAVLNLAVPLLLVWAHWPSVDAIGS